MHSIRDAHPTWFSLCFQSGGNIYTVAIDVIAIQDDVAEIYSNAKITLTSVDRDHEGDYHSPVHKALSGIEMPSILFFLGILMAVAALESLGILFTFANQLAETIPMLGTEPQIPGYAVSDLVVILMGVGSAIIGNVPLVAASLGMFSDPTDSPLWHFIAYAAGTGRSMLIIGSASQEFAVLCRALESFLPTDSQR